MSGWLWWMEKVTVTWQNMGFGIHMNQSDSHLFWDGGWLWCMEEVTVTWRNMGSGIHMNKSDSHLFCDGRIALVEIFTRRLELVSHYKGCNEFISRKDKILS